MLTASYGGVCDFSSDFTVPGPPESKFDASMKSVCMVKFRAVSFSIPVLESFGSWRHRRTGLLGLLRAIRVLRLVGWWRGGGFHCCGFMYTILYGVITDAFVIHVMIFNFTRLGLHLAAAILLRTELRRLSQILYRNICIDASRSRHDPAGLSLLRTCLCSIIRPTCAR